jgi:hypothetical protein
MARNNRRKCPIGHRQYCCLAPKGTSFGLRTQHRDPKRPQLQMPARVNLLQDRWCKPWRMGVAGPVDARCHRTGKTSNLERCWTGSLVYEQQTAAVPHLIRKYVCARCVGHAGIEDHLLVSAPDRCCEQLRDPVFRIWEPSLSVVGCSCRHTLNSVLRPFASRQTKLRLSFAGGLRSVCEECRDCCLAHLPVHASSRCFIVGPHLQAILRGRTQNAQKAGLHRTKTY